MRLSFRNINVLTLGHFSFSPFFLWLWCIGVDDGHMISNDLVIWGWIDVYMCGGSAKIYDRL